MSSLLIPKENKVCVQAQADEGTEKNDWNPVLVENGSTDGKVATRWTLLPDASSRTLDLISTSYHDFLSKIHRL